MRWNLSQHIKLHFLLWRFNVIKIINQWMLTYFFYFHTINHYHQTNHRLHNNFMNLITTMNLKIAQPIPMEKNRILFYHQSHGRIKGFFFSCLFDNASNTDLNDATLRSLGPILLEKNKKKFLATLE